MSKMKTREPSPPDPVRSDKPKAYTIKYKRPRGLRACTVCRARKVRCDAEIHIPCTNCITFGCDCLLPMTKKRGTPQEKPKKRHSVKPEPYDEQPAPPPPPVAPVPSAAPKSTAEPIHNISQVSVPPSLTSDHKHRPQKRELIHADANSKASLTFVGHLSVSLMAQKIGQNHVQLTEDLFDTSDNLLLDLVELEILKMRGAFLLPPHELALDLVNLYFEHVHPLMPVINRTEFMAQFLDPNDSPSLMLLQAVLLCGSRVSKNPLLFDSKGLSNLALLTFFRRAKALYETNYESDPILIIHTVILIGSYWEGPEDVTRNSFYWTRVGVGLAQGFGLQRDISNSPTLTATEKKIWRRTWWCLFEKDRNVAIAFGRPPTIDLTDCDVPMLTMEDFDESTPGGPDLPYPVNDTQALYFIHLVKLAEITGIIIKHQYTVKAELMKRTNKFSVIQHCDMLMGIWFTNLPSQLLFSLTDPSKQSFYACLLNAQYYNRLYLIHRANLLRMARSSSTNPSNYKYPSWGISFQAARMISIVSKILLDKGMLKYCPVMFVYILFSALIMLIYHVDSTNPVIASTASDSLFISRAVLKEMGKYWPIARLLMKLFDKYGNDKIKRAEVIERGTVIAEMQERRKSHFSDSRLNQKIKQEFPAVTSPSNLTTSGISPRGGSYRRDILPSGGYNGITKPNIDQLVRQAKADTGEELDEHIQKNTNTENTPSSIHSFPDISLVTEKIPPNQNFFENFEPTQLFPNANISYPSTRAHSPNPEQENPRKPDELNPFSGSIYGSSTNINSAGDLFTNFMDSSYINMNLQATAEEESYLNDDFGSLLNFQSIP